MRFIELRRHSKRDPLNRHLSHEGVTIARHVGSSMGPFNHVITSPSPWTYETAIAMGFAVDEQYDPVAPTSADQTLLGALLSPGTPFDERAHAMATHPVAQQFAADLHRQWAYYADNLGDGDSALVITHGGYVDDSAVACLPNDKHAKWGINFRHCEGIRLTFKSGRCIHGELLRLPDLWYEKPWLLKEKR